MLPYTLPSDFGLVLTTGQLNLAETPLKYHRPLPPNGLAQLGGCVEDAVSDGRWSEAFDQLARTGRPTGYRPSGQVMAIDNMRDSFYGEYSDERFIARIEAFATRFAPDRLFIGFYALSDMMLKLPAMLRLCRTHFPYATLMVGGPHATFFPHDFYIDRDGRSGPLVDYVVRNEGERAIIGILAGDLTTEESLRAHATKYELDPDKCDYSDPNLRVIDGGQFGRERSDDSYGPHVLDQLPAPAYFLFARGNGSLPYEPDRRYGLEAPAASANTSRGCPHKCVFCVIPKLVPGYRTHSPERMLAIARLLRIDHGVQSLFFREDNFLYSGGMIAGDRWDDVQEFAERASAELPGMRYAIEARADNLLMDAGGGRSRLDVLAAAGFSGIYVGVESGTDQVLKQYGKGATVATMAAAIRGCQERGIAVVATACYSDPDLHLRSRYALIRPDDTQYRMDIIRERERVLAQTRAFMDAHDIPLERREEYVLLGIPVSTTYNLLDRERHEFPQLVEYVDPATRYIFPKGFQWWAARAYGSGHRVRAYFGYDTLAGV